MAQGTKSENRLRVAHLNPRQATPFTLTPDADTRAALADELGATELPRLRMRGQITAAPNDAWLLEAQLDAQIVQPSVVSLASVTTTISEPVRRVFSPHLTTPEGDEVEMPDDDVESLGQFIDLEAIMAEALVLATPLYPRAEGDAAPQPEQPTQETRKPFADLAALLKDRDKLS